MSRPSVSVVIPAYRAAGTIGYALESALSQTRPPDEVLVVDDGSPDDLAAAVAPFAGRATLIRKPNGGASSARNLGVDRARGDLVAFLDADDYWEPEKLARQLDVLEAHPDLGFVACRYYLQEPGRPRFAHRAEPDHFLGRRLALSGRELFEFATWVWTSSVVARRPLLLEHRFVSGLEPAEDRDLWTRLAIAAPAYLVEEHLATGVLTPGSLSRSSTASDYPNMLRVVRRHRDLLGRRGLRDWETRVFRKWAAGHLNGGHPRDAIRPALSRLRRQPLSPEGWWVLAKSGVLAIRRPDRPTPAATRGGGPSVRLASSAVEGVRP